MLAAIAIAFHLERGPIDCGGIYWEKPPPLDDAVTPESTRNLRFELCGKEVTWRQFWAHYRWKLPTSPEPGCCGPVPIA